MENFCTFPHIKESCIYSIAKLSHAIYICHIRRMTLNFETHLKKKWVSTMSALYLMGVCLNMDLVCIKKVGSYTADYPILGTSIVDYLNKLTF